MNHDPQADIAPEKLADIEQDALLWRTLGKASEHRASPRFADDVCRAVRLLPAAKPWWAKLFAPLPMAATASVATALVTLGFFVFNQQIPAPSVVNTPATENIVSDEIQDLAETEALDAAIDHMDKFSDVELVSLCGF